MRVGIERTAVSLMLRRPQDRLGAIRLRRGRREREETLHVVDEEVLAAESLGGEAAIEIGVGEPRIFLDRLVELVHRRLPLLLEHAGDADLQRDQGVARIGFARPLQRLNRLVIAAEPLQGHAPVILPVPAPLRAAELLGLAERGVRIAPLALAQQGLTEIEEGRRIGRRQLGRLAQPRLGVAVLLLLLQHPSERRGNRAVAVRLAGDAVDRRAGLARLVLPELAVDGPHLGWSRLLGRLALAASPLAASTLVAGRRLVLRFLLLAGFEDRRRSEGDRDERPQGQKPEERRRSENHRGPPVVDSPDQYSRSAPPEPGLPREAYGATQYRNNAATSPASDSAGMGSTKSASALLRASSSTSSLIRSTLKMFSEPQMLHFAGVPASRFSQSRQRVPAMRASRVTAIFSTRPTAAALSTSSTPVTARPPRRYSFLIRSQSCSSDVRSAVEASEKAVSNIGSSPALKSTFCLPASLAVSGAVSAPSISTMVSCEPTRNSRLNFSFWSISVRTSTISLA